MTRVMNPYLNSFKLSLFSFYDQLNLEIMQRIVEIRSYKNSKINIILQLLMKLVEKSNVLMFEGRTEEFQKKNGMLRPLNILKAVKGERYMFWKSSYAREK